MRTGVDAHIGFTHIADFALNDSGGQVNNNFVTDLVKMCIRDRKEKRVLNQNETTLAQQKQQAIKDAFCLLYTSLEFEGGC